VNSVTNPLPRSGICPKVKFLGVAYASSTASTPAIGGTFDQLTQELTDGDHGAAPGPGMVNAVENHNCTTLSLQRRLVETAGRLVRILRFGPTLRRILMLWMPAG
jgi:hypothetical protein